MTWEVRRGDCVEAMAAMEPCSVDAVVCDPPYHLAFMGRSWDTVTPGQSQHEHERWAREALRVLKPGGHLLAFGGTRTYHRLVAGVEDAGFEIRDTISWMYGSGFPKSLDVGKAIDKLNGKPLDRLREFGVWMRTQREAAGLTAAEVNRRMGMPQGCGWWEGKGVGEKWDLHLPSVATFHKLRLLYGAGDEWDSFIEWAEAERVSTGRDGRQAASSWLGTQDGVTSTWGRGEWDRRDVPATPEAERWQGWGTALKPSAEPVVVARKPLSGTVAATVLEHGTGALNVDGCRVDTGGEEWAGNEANAHKDYSGKVFGEFGRQYAKPSNPAGRWPPNVLLSHSGGCVRVGTRKVRSAGDGGAPRASTDDWRFRPGKGHGDADGMETVESWDCEPSCPVRLLDEQTGESVHGAGAAREASEGTHGGDRVEGWGNMGAPAMRFGDSGGASRFFPTFDNNHEEAECANANTAVSCSNPPSESGGSAQDGAATSGRPVDLESLAGSQRGPGSTPQHKQRTQTPNPASAESPDSSATTSSTTTPPLSSGCVSGAMPLGIPINETADESDQTRFRYQSKAGRAERNAGLDGFEERASDHRWNKAGEWTDETTPAKNNHPTVKPIELMRWLVRLVTPPGGTVLDPFTGSGSTGAACVLEGFDFIGIEREPEYADIAEARIGWWFKHRGDGLAAAVLAAGEVRDAVEATGQLELDW